MKTKRKPRAYFVEYNGKIMGIYKTLLGALKLIKRKGWQDDFDNSLWLVDNNGDSYNPLNGELKKGIL